MFHRTAVRRFTRRSLACAGTIVAFAACSDSKGLVEPALDARLARGGPSTPDVPVITDLGSGLSYSSDNGAVYTHNVAGVISKIQAVGDWEMSTIEKNATRSSKIAFDMVVSGVTPFTLPTAVPSRYISKKSLSPTAPGRFQDMNVGDTASVPLAVAFTHGGKQYRLAMNPVNQPGSEWATATCLAGSPCTDWQLTPTGADGRNGSVLLEVAKNGSETVRATVRMSFLIRFSE